MKEYRFLMIVAVVLFLASWVQSGPARTATDAMYPGDFGSAYALDTDTLKDSTVICTVLTSTKPRGDIEYLLTVPAVTGAGADSTKIGVYVEALDRSGSHMWTLLVDSITDSAGGQVLLPYVSKIAGTSYNTWIKGLYGQGSVVLLPDSAFVYTRKPRALR